MSLIRKILLTLGGIILLEGLLLSWPKIVDAACSSTWACSPNCIVTDCTWHPWNMYEPYEACNNGGLASYGPVDCGAPGTYGGEYYACGAVLVPGVEADCATLHTTSSSCIGYASSGYRGCSGSPDATPTPTSPPSGPTNTPVPTATPTPIPNSPPTGTLSCPSQIFLGQSGTFTLNGSDVDSNLVNAGLYYSFTSGQHWYRNDNNDCNTQDCSPNISCVGAGCTSSPTWTPTAAGTYYVAANYYDSAGGKCTGNPWTPYSEGWVACGNPNSYCTVTVPAPSPPTLTCGAFNQAEVYTPVTATWANGTGLQVTRDYAPETIPIPADQYWLYNAAASSGIIITPPAGKYMPPGHWIYARTTYDWNTFSATTSKYCDPPANPDPATIQGNLEQKTGTGCYTASAPDHTFNVSSISSTTSNGCVTSVCKADPGDTLPNAATTGYNCDITFDGTACLNQNPPTWPTSATVNLTGANAAGVSFIGWTDPPGTCQTAPTNNILVAAGSSTTKNLTLNFNGDHWLKTKNTSFTASSTTNNDLPIWVNKFTPSDSDDDPLQKYFIMSSPGSSAGVALDITSNSYSFPNWYDSSYGGISLHMSPSGFLNYVKSRKEHVSKNVSDIENNNLEANKINFIAGDVNIDTPSKEAAIVNKAPLVIIVTGNIAINLNNKFNSAEKSVALISTGEISFSSQITEANGLFIAQTVNTGSTTNQGLKIKGNLIAQSSFTNGRSWADTSRPSVFVVFDQQQYIDLLPYLSTASYEWNQTQ